MGQSFLDYLNLLHAQGVTLADAGKSGLVQNEQFVMVSTAGVAAGFEERLGSWKYCKLGTSTFTCILNMVFFICVMLGIILSRVSCNVAVVNKSSGATCVISACC